MNDNLKHRPAPALNVKRILQILDSHDVRFLIVGGMATVAYGSSRLTWDIDVLPKYDDHNLSKLVDALNELNAELRISDEKTLATDFDIESLSRNQIIECRTDFGDLDILKNMLMEDFHRADFDELAANSNETQAYGITIYLASLADIIGSKKAASRPKDLIDIPVLEELLRQIDKQN